MSQKNSLTWFIKGCSSGFSRELTRIVVARGFRAVVILAGSFGVLAALGGASRAQPPLGTVKNIVLVHGAFADGSSWGKTIPILESRGFHVTAVQNPLTSLADDAYATRRIIALQDGPVILVGHSWGGAVI